MYSELLYDLGGRKRSDAAFLRYGSFGNRGETGPVPHAAPQPMQATVTGRIDGKMVTRTYRLTLARHTSIWHGLIPTGFEDRAVARAVLQAIRRGSEDPTL
ncbi:MAG: hypothetical protein KDK97_16480 [Verrucomicrobiales bacterium]|nr:hypothetical protein [Verrucomicrobiales bacterium]MCP5560246.1 hypothetical protein [Verrucomicrobiaceae bacterium]